MSNVANARQRLATKAIRANGGQIFEGFEFGSREAFAQYWQVLFLGDISI
jgi:hypothetical protein